MASELLLVNPRRRKRRSGGRRRRRSMSALQRKYFGGGRRKRRSSPRRRRRAAALAGPMPARRTRRVGRRHRRRSRRARSFGRRASVSMRGFNFNSFLRDTLIPSGVGAAGAIGVDVLLGYLQPKLPAALQTGIAVPLTRIAGAVGLGMAASMVTKDRRMGEQVMAGAITVVLYQYARTLVKQQFPTLPLSGYVSGMGYAGPALAYGDMGAYVGSSQPWNPSIAARVARGTTRTVVPRLGGVTNDEYIESGYSYA